jgi:hypothetical protein
MSDATQQGADDIKPSVNPRNAAIAQMAANVHETIHAPEMQDFNEDTGEVLPRDDKGRFAARQEDAPVDDEPAENALTEEAAPVETPAEKRFKVKVYGQEQEVPESELIQSYQISAAARRQLEAANAAKRQYEEALARIGQTTRLPEGEAENNLQTEVGRPAIPPAQVISAIVRHEVEQNEAVASFKREFADIASDPVLYREAIAREDQRLWRVKNGVEPDRPLIDALKEHGEAIRKWKSGIATPAVSTDKLARKAAISNVPSASLRAPAPQQPKALSLTEQIEQMRKARGQPVN